MKKRVFSLYLPVSLAVLGTLGLLAKVMGFAGVFRIGTDAMMPNFTPPENILVCWWPSVARNEAVAYYDTSLALPGHRTGQRELFVGRVAGIGGDRLSMSEGRVFIDGKPSEAGERRLFFWKLGRADFEANRPRFGSKPMPAGPDSVWVALEESQALDIQQFVGLQRCVFPIKTPLGDNRWGIQAERWTTNDFGPITIPPGFVFILGDHRHNSEDSRHRGLVPESDIFGKVLF